MAFFLSPERLDAAIGRGPLLLLGGLGVAVTSSAWGEIGCVTAGLIAWTGATSFLFLDWRMNLAARLLAVGMLFLTVGMAAPIVSRASREVRLLRVADLVGAGIILTIHARFLVSVVRGEGRYTPDEVPPLDLRPTRRPIQPGHEGLTRRNGLREMGNSDP